MLGPADVFDVAVEEVAATVNRSDTSTELSDGASIHEPGKSPVYVVVNGLPAESVAVNV